MSSSTESLAESLSELLARNVAVDHQEACERDGLNLIIADISYRSSDPDSRSTQWIRETVAVPQEPIDLPQFAMFPHFKGIIGAVFSAIGGMNDVNFDDSPEFSADYLLHAWNEKAVRVLFTPEIRDYFAQHPGWSIRGDRNHIAIFNHKAVCKSDERESFVSDAAEIFRLFQSGEAELDRHPEITRETQVQDAMAAAENMGGIAGRILRKELNRIALSSAEVQSFLAQPIPRLEIPGGLQRQVIADLKMLIAMGVVFCIVGVVVPVLCFVTLQGNDRLLAVPFAGTFLLAGGLMLFFSLRHGRRKHRLLRQGTLHSGRVERVERTDTEVNGRRRYVLHLSDDFRGKSRKSKANVYAGIERTKSLAEQGTPVRILVDPEDENHVLCVDALVISE